MSESPEDFLQLSNNALQDIEGMKDADTSLRALYNRLYYALFYAAKAALLSKDITPKTHRGTASQVYQVLYDDKELIEREEAILLQKLQQKRDMADYELEVDFDKEDFEEDLQGVKNFIDTVNRILN